MDKEEKEEKEEEKEEVEKEVEEKEEETIFISMPLREERFLHDSQNQLSLKRGQCVFWNTFCTIVFRFVRLYALFIYLFFFFFFNLLTFVVCLESFIASRSSRLPIRQSSIENIYVYYLRTNHLIIIELFAHITARERFET